jgi:hypothetical protein
MPPAHPESGIEKVTLPLKVLLAIVAGPSKGIDELPPQTLDPTAMPTENIRSPIMTLSATMTFAKLPLYVFRLSTMLIAPNDLYLSDEMMVFSMTLVLGAPNSTIPPSVGP